MKYPDVRTHVLFPAHVRFELQLQVARVTSEAMRQPDFLAFARAGRAAAFEGALSSLRASSVKRVYHIQFVVVRSLREPDRAHAIRRRDMNLPRDVLAGASLSVEVGPRL